MESKFATKVRNAVISSVPYLTFLHERMSQAIGMLDISYKCSSIVQDYVKNNSWVTFSSIVEMGARVPHITTKLLRSGEEQLLMRVCSKDFSHNLFLFITNEKDEELIQQTKSLLRRYRGFVTLHLVVCGVVKDDFNPDGFENIFSDNHLSDVLGIHNSGFVLVRPDQHLSFRNSPANIHQLQDYLQSIFI